MTARPRARCRAGPDSREPVPQPEHDREESREGHEDGPEVADHADEQHEHRRDQRDERDDRQKPSQRTWSTIIHRSVLLPLFRHRLRPAPSPAPANAATAASIVGKKCGGRSSL